MNTEPRSGKSAGVEDNDMSRWLAIRLTAAVVAVGLAFGLLEIGAYLYFRHRNVGDHDLHIFEASRDGMPIAVKRQATQSWKQPEFQVTVRTNAIGLREDFELPAGRRVDVGFLGDSFTFGHGVEAGERYSDIVRNRVGDRLVVNYSYMNGWTTPHYYLFLKDHAAFVPGVAVIGLFLGNDLSHDMLESELFLSSDGDLQRVRSRVREIAPDGSMVLRDGSNTLRRLLRRFWSGQLLLHLNHHLGFNLRWLHPAPIVLVSCL